YQSITFVPQVHASSVISLLQSDIKTALKSAFGILDGPLPVTDWCRGRNKSGEITVDGYSAESTISECKIHHNHGAHHHLVLLDQHQLALKCIGWRKSGRDIPKKIKTRKLYFF
ncbi:hypothetical protein Prudu_015377, partial [Prunus dulcis]